MRFLKVLTKRKEKEDPKNLEITHKWMFIENVHKILCFLIYFLCSIIKLIIYNLHRIKFPN